MTIYELAHARVRRNGMTESQATACLAQLARSAAWRDVNWQDTVPYLSGLLKDRIDWCAARWMTNPDNAPKPLPITVRQYRDTWPSGQRDGKALAPGDEGPEAV